MKYYHRFLCMLLACLACLMLTSCGSRTNSFTWFVDAIPSNLDPQIATRSEDIIACTNLYGTLLREDTSGALVPDLAASYTISDDKRTYTFTLKPDNVYHTRSAINDKYTLTAQDFVFAFARIFNAQTNSPYADLYANLQNSAEVLDGTLPMSALGVKATDANTLVFTLSAADPAFLETLALPAAAPCNQDFFESTGGTYGLTSKTTLSSGGFYLYNWTDTGLFLRRDGDGTLVDNLRLVENSDTTGMNAQTLITEEKCTAAIDKSTDATALDSLSYSDTTWSLLYHQSGALENAALRAALSVAALEASMMPTDTYLPTVEGIVPNGIEIEGVDYRKENGSALASLSPATDYFTQALTTLSVNELKGITLLLPAGYQLEDYAANINSNWQKELSLYFSVEVVDQKTFDARLASGDYTIALAPITITQSDVTLFLQQLSSNYGLGYRNSSYQAILQLATTVGGTQKRNLLYQAECMLLEEVALTPLFTQQKRLLIDPSIANLVFDPFGPALDLTYATKS